MCACSWGAVQLLASPIAALLNDDDKHVMEYLTDVIFVESDNPTIKLVCKHKQPQRTAGTFFVNGRCAEQIFAPNPFFKNTEIIKSFRVVEEALESQPYDIEWLPVCCAPHHGFDNSKQQTVHVWRLLNRVVT